MLKIMEVTARFSYVSPMVLLQISCVLLPHKPIGLLSSRSGTRFGRL